MAGSDDDIEMRYDQARVTPFWQKLPFFFLFPFRFSPLIFLTCIVAASAIAGLALGPFGLVFKGLLVYFGLRYAFNVLELFSKGRFEGESPDHRLWGPEKRPAKLGVVLALFITLGASIGNVALGNRIATDEGVQERLVERYRQANAEEFAELERQRDEYQRRLAKAQQEAAAVAARAAAAKALGSSDEDAAAAAAEAAPMAELPADIGPAPTGPTRADMVERSTPLIGEPLWFALQPMWFWFFMGFVSLLLPSAAITIALEDSLLRAFNPLNVVHFMQAMGKAYIVLWMFFLAIAGTRHLTLTMGAGWPTFLRFPIEMALANYLGLVLFAIMGYALYQHHQELHLEVDVDFDEHREAGGAEAIASAGSARAALQKSGAPADPWERKLHDLVAAGNFKEAIAEVKDRMRYDRLDVPMNAKLHDLLVQQGDAAALLAHVPQHVTALVRGKRPQDAVAVLRKATQLDAAFTLEDGDCIYPVANAAVQQREFALATALLRAFDKRFPKHQDTPLVFFLGARLLSEQSRQHDKAARILRAVLQNFPDHAVAAEARTYLKVLENMIAKAAVAG